MKTAKLDGRPWKAVNDFENHYRKTYLSKLTEKKSLEIFNNLYQFCVKLSGKSYFRKLDSMKIETLTKARSRFAKVRP